MGCFVIMPFDSAFDDVYTAIKQSVLSVRHLQASECSRLDETRPAGRITDRLLAALRKSSFCIADVTGCNANVMWEIGYVMALGKPLILITQDLSTLPFDLKDVQAISYDRARLNKSLSAPLAQVVRDTLVALPKSDAQEGVQAEKDNRLVVSLGVQLSELKEMVGQIVATWPVSTRARPSVGPLPESLRRLEGEWVTEENNTHIYVKVIGNVLVAPYCYDGNLSLTAYHYEWKEIGEYVFARFKWLQQPISGFIFLKQSGEETLHGAWWYDYDVDSLPETPPLRSGNQTTWYRTKMTLPHWAKDFFDRVRLRGMKDYPL